MTRAEAHEQTHAIRTRLSNRAGQQLQQLDTQDLDMVDRIANDFGAHQQPDCIEGALRVRRVSIDPAHSSDAFGWVRKRTAEARHAGLVPASSDVNDLAAVLRAIIDCVARQTRQNRTVVEPDGAGGQRRPAPSTPATPDPPQPKLRR